MTGQVHDKATENDKALSQAKADRISHISWFWYVLLFPLHRFLMRIVMPTKVVNRHWIPGEGPVIFAPTHRTRIDALTLGMLARPVRFLTTEKVFLGPQRFFMRRLGAFAVNAERPGADSLRHCQDLLESGKALVIFPEGRLYYIPPNQVGPLRPGTAWLALRVFRKSHLEDLKIVPVRLNYSQPYPSIGTRIEVRVCEPISLAQYNDLDVRQAIEQLTDDLHSRLGDSFYEPTEEELAAADQTAEGYRNRWSRDVAASSSPTSSDV